MRVDVTTGLDVGMLADKNASALAGADECVSVDLDPAFEFDRAALRVPGEDDISANKHVFAQTKIRVGNMGGWIDETT